MSVKVQLLRRLGQNLPGSVLSRTTQEAEWLVANGYAEPIPDEPPTVAVAATRAPQAKGRR
jgi:hypothetical protein